MTFASDRHYDADPAATFELFSDPEMVAERYRSMGDRDIEIVRCEPDGDGFVIESRRVVEVDLPGFAKKVLSPTNTMVQIDRWSSPDADGGRTGTWDVSVEGAPVATKGSMRLTPDGGGTRHHIEGTIEVKVPIVGGRIAKWSEGTAGDKLEAELDFHADRLSG